MKFLIFFFVIFSSVNLWAWGRRGHETVASLAAQLLAKENPKAQFLENHSYDLGYYANVPDLVWKANSESRRKEEFQHYLDLEIYEKAFKEQNAGDSPWIADRKEFFKKFPSIPTTAGRAPWRIQELSESVSSIVQRMKDKRLSLEEHQKLQAQWLLHAGVLGHYIGDLSMPLHVSEDYDGKNSGQSGLHSWFEDKMVDDLYPQFAHEVFTRAQKRWKDFQKSNTNKTPFELALDLANDSRKNIPELLKMDKKQGRSDISKAAPVFKELIIERLTASVLRLSLIWSNQLGWEYNGTRFFMWQGAPNYIEPVAEKITERKK